MQNGAFVAKEVNVRLTKIFMAIFALAERLPTSATLDPRDASATKNNWFSLVVNPKESNDISLPREQQQCVDVSIIMNNNRITQREKFFLLDIGTQYDAEY